MEAYSEDLVAEIHHLLKQRWQFKQQSKWEQADEIQRKLWEAPYHAKVIDKKSSNNNSNIIADGSACGSDWVPRIFGSGSKKDPPRVFWENLDHDMDETTSAKPCSRRAPFVIGTVDSDSYRNRYEDTIQHLEQWQTNCSCCQTTTQCCTSLQIQKCYLLNLQEFPSIGIKKILFEGWRQKLIPKLRLQYSSQVDENAYTDSNDSNPFPLFVFVAEDDIRIPDHLSPCRLVSLCGSIFASHPELDVLSLGHSWKALCNKKQFAGPQQSLLEILQSAKNGGVAGVHASTLMAIRVPRGLETLQETMDMVASKKKQTHLDQFLFFSPYHTLQIALCDPPLAGWAEVETTLTPSASGHRRRGGGRLGFVPAITSNPTTTVMDVAWVRRCHEESSSDLEK